MLLSSWTSIQTSAGWIRITDPPFFFPPLHCSSVSAVIYFLLEFQVLFRFLFRVPSAKSVPKTNAGGRGNVALGDEVTLYFLPFKNANSSAQGVCCYCSACLFLQRICPVTCSARGDKVARETLEILMRLNGGDHSTLVGARLTLGSDPRARSPPAPFCSSCSGSWLILEDEGMETKCFKARQ